MIGQSGKVLSCIHQKVDIVASSQYVNLLMLSVCIIFRFYNGTCSIPELCVYLQVYVYLHMHVQFQLHPWKVEQWTEWKRSKHLELVTVEQRQLGAVRVVS